MTGLKSLMINAMTIKINKDLIWPHPIKNISESSCISTEDWRSLYEGNYTYVIPETTPYQIKVYLLREGWIEGVKLGFLGLVWHRPISENRDFEITIPESQDHNHFIQRVFDLVLTLSRFEESSMDDIYRDISNVK